MSPRDQEIVIRLALFLAGMFVAYASIVALFRHAGVIP